jgi:hypothetical protein
MDRESDLLIKIKARLAVYDENALAALANRGLLRRAQKDLEDGQPIITGETDGFLEMSVCEAVVRLSEVPQESKCTCPSGTICRHILAAVIFVQNLPVEANLKSRNSCAEEILAVDDAALKKWSGIELVRRATRKLSTGYDVEIEDGPQVVFTIPAIEVTCRWMPGCGLAGMLCSCHSRRPCEHRVMAVLAYQASRGERTIEEDVCVMKASPGAPRTREEVLASVGVVLREMVTQGFSRLSENIEQRLQTLAVSAHGVDLPRLERQLRTVSDEVRLLLARDAQADSRNLMIAAARTEALRSALSHPTARLVGEHRSSYEPVGALELAGVGARRWQTRSGYAGLTVYFWDRKAERWATWTDSRPTSVERFDPLERYEDTGPWEGCSSPSDACRAEIKLLGAWRNRNGRLSGRPSTRASGNIKSNPPTLPPAADNWSTAAERAARLFTEGFRDRGEQDEIVMLVPKEWDRPEFDQVRQEMVWPVRDSDGRELRLVLPHTNETSHAMSVIESFGKASPVGLLGLIRLSAGRVVVEPVTLYQKSGEMMNLTLDAGSIKKKRKNWVTALIEIDEDDDRDELLTGSSTNAIGLLLSAVETELQTIADSGVTASRDTSRLRKLTARVESVGLTTCAAATSQVADMLDQLARTTDGDAFSAGEALLRAYYIIRVASTQDQFVCPIQMSSFQKTNSSSG